MSYLDVYWSRINHLGESTAERIRNGGIRSFEKWLEESPHTMRNLSVERGLYFDGIILTSKDKTYQKIMLLNVSNNIPLLVGDIMNWILDDGSTEKWILIQEEKKVNGTYRTFWIVRCNYLLKWIDKLGHLQQSWAYVVSSVDSKIKGNYRTWNSLITPQPNKYAEILMPRYPIERSTNFIVEDESWSVIEYDHTSVPGTIYLSLTENKINKIYDDVENNIADLDKRAKYRIILPLEKSRFSIGDEITGLIFTIMKNEIPYTTDDIEFFPEEIGKVVKRQDKLYAAQEGETNILVKIKEYDDIDPVELKIPIEICNESTITSYYLEGPDSIKLARSGFFIIRSNSGGIGLQADSFSVSDDTMVKVREIEKTENNITSWSYEVKANDKNKLTEANKPPVILSVTIDNQEIQKEIKIVPLW